ncbi:MAG: hypothetical protein LCH69_12780 [Proteobacteria bacterium]|nr:hypothetical protein [Pseudomonadota bacterium]
MEQPKQMGSERAEPREGAQVQQQGSQQQPVQRRGDEKKPASQMQGTQFRDWASI